MCLNPVKLNKLLIKFEEKELTTDDWEVRKQDIEITTVKKQVTAIDTPKIFRILRDNLKQNNRFNTQLFPIYFLKKFGNKLDSLDFSLSPHSPLHHY